MSILMLIPLCFDYCSLVESFEIRSVSPPTLFFLQYCFGYLGVTNFCMSFKISLSISAKVQIEILMGMVLNLKINLRSLAILMVLDLQIHEHGMFFYLFRSSLTSFNDIL